MGWTMLTLLLVGQYFICEAARRQDSTTTDTLHMVPPFSSKNCTAQVSRNSNSSTVIGPVSRSSQEDLPTQLCIIDTHVDNNTSISKPVTEMLYLSRDQYEYYRNVIVKCKTVLHWMSAVMCFLAMLSFTRANVCNTSKGFFIALNLFEMMSSLISIGSFVLGSVLGIFHEIWATYSLYAITFISISSRRVVYVLNMVMSAQRMIVVVLPLQTRAAFSPRVNLVLITSIIVVTFGAHSYIPLTYSVRQIGEDKFVIASSQLYLENIELFHGIRNVLVIFFSFCPLLVSLLANFFLVYSLRIHFMKARELRATQNSTKGQDGQITYMIISSTLVFTLLSLPLNANLLLETFLPNYGSYKKEKYLFSIIREVFYTLLVLGDITNFMFYACLSSAFRGYLASLLSPLLLSCAVCDKSNRTQMIMTSTHVIPPAVDQTPISVTTGF